MKKIKDLELTESEYNAFELMLGHMLARYDRDIRIRLRWYDQGIDRTHIEQLAVKLGIEHKRVSFSYLNR